MATDVDTAAAPAQPGAAPWLDRLGSTRQAVIARLGEGVVVQDSTGRIMFCNPAAERILGLTADQIEGRTSLDPRWRSVHRDGSPFPGDQHPAMVALRTGETVRNVVMGVHKPNGELTWIVIDAEHGHLDWKEILEHLRATVRSSTVALVRVAELNAGLIKRALDIGADGVVIPWIETPEQLQQAMIFAKYPAEGLRGIGAERATAWGQCFVQHTRDANEHVLVVPIFESVAAGRNRAELARVPGLEVAFVGPADYSSSAGFRGQWEGPGVAAQLLAIKDALRKNGRHCGVMTTSAEDLRERRDQGFRLLSVGTDSGLFLRSLHAALAGAGCDRQMNPELQPDPLPTMPSPGAAATPTALPASLDWVPAIVPGTAAQALQAAGRFSAAAPHPLHDKDIWYHVPLNERGPRTLRFEGLATCAEVWLNANRLLESANMFRTHEIDVELAGDDHLFIVFRSLDKAIESRVAEKRGGRARWRTRLVENNGLRLVRTTLLGHMTGWQPAIHAVGPWRPISLIEQSPLVRVRAHDLQASLEGDDGVLKLTLELDRQGIRPAAVLHAGSRRAMWKRIPTPEPALPRRRVSGSG